MAYQNRLTRIEKVLDYIHENLDESIHVTNLAEKSCWSRWQFQRVFGQATGLTVAQYIRELRLSKAAELLLCSTIRHVDIAMQCGFDSEISFSRAFKQMFNCTPRNYRQRGKRYGLRTPLQYRSLHKTHTDTEKTFTQIRIESRDDFQIQGRYDWIRGPFSSAPDFSERVPQLWFKVMAEIETVKKGARPIGIIDTQDHLQHPDQMLYWAGYLEPIKASSPTTFNGAKPFNTTLDTVKVPLQEYAVIPVHGKATAVEKAFEWFIHHWLPESNYYGVQGYELEVYEPDYDPNSPQSYMEYWLPIKPR
ncbi:AraC family transcriptional regulator [Marinomonas rhizomae]|uniref:AraC family transcriptional regulator n=1 Tax=Marinomonas rhizomae TaxID=491948 RepID=UPI002106D0EA|nr:AraC family transcriptional regulator [Marinomonas rhizomae]UTV99577.1 AraC family transcriptional regulator [Marinomonas rhizomae]